MKSTFINKLLSQFKQNQKNNIANLTCLIHKLYIFQSLWVKQVNPDLENVGVSARRNPYIFLVVRIIHKTYELFGLNFSHKTYITILLFIVACLSLGSCAKEIEEISWDTNTQAPMLVVDGALTNQLKNHGVRLTQSNDYFSTDNPIPVHSAVVSISDGENSYNFTERPENDGVYLSDDAFAGVPGKTYDLHIVLSQSINGQESYSSFMKMPQGLDIDSIRCEMFDMPENNFDEDIKDTTALLVYYYGYEPKAEGNYYFAKIFRNRQPMFSNVKDYPFSSDEDRNGEYTNIMATIKNVADSDTISFNLYSIGKDYYNYIDALSKIDETGNIYSPQGPPANALGNIEGALGFFVTTYVSSGESKVIRAK